MGRDPFPAMGRYLPDRMHFLFFAFPAQVPSEKRGKLIGPEETLIRAHPDLSFTRGHNHKKIDLGGANIALVGFFGFAIAKILRDCSTFCGHHDLGETGIAHAKHRCTLKNRIDD